MSALRTVIVDDEALARRGLALRLEAFPEIELVAQCSSGAEALRVIGEQQPDLVFIDIQMPGMNGFEVIARLPPERMPLIIFVTAFDRYAVDAFNVHAIDYVLKPIDEERLTQAVQKALAQRERDQSVQLTARLLALLEQVGRSGAGPAAAAVAEPAHSTPKLAIRDGSTTHFVRIASIDWVDAARDYMCVHCGETTHIMRSTMKQLEEQLGPHRFLRVHRSVLVNAASVTAIETLENGDCLLSLRGGQQVKASRRYRDRLEQLL